MAKGNPEAYKNSLTANPEKGCDVQPGDNTRYIRHALKFFNLPPVDISDPKQVEERILWYFNECAENDMKPGVVGLANALGVDRKTLLNWAKGTYRADSHLHLIKNAYNFIENMWEQNTLGGKINPVGAIFYAKNNFGYTDTVQLEARPAAPLTDLDPEEVRRKYDELPE